MTIDEWIEKAKLNAKVNVEYPTDKMLLQEAEEYAQLADWLEELKSIKENSISKEAFEKMKSKACKKGHRQGYNKAIDDFVNKINESNQGHWRVTRYEHGEAVSETMSYDIGTIKLIAEQLKVGGEDE